MNCSQCKCGEYFYDEDEAQTLCYKCRPVIRGMSEWQPIDTAPQDGTRMLLRYGHDTPFVGYWYTTERAWKSTNGYVRLPTEWARLPQESEATG